MLKDIVFKTKNDKQLEAAQYWVDDVTEEILYGGGKGGGKSFLGCSLIFGDALIYPETHYFIARGELTDLRKFTIPTIHEVFQKWGLSLDEHASYNGQDNVFILNNGSKVYLLSCKPIPSDPLFERFGSMQMTKGMIEEGGEVTESAKANLWLSIGRWKNQEYGLKKKLLITANPKKGWMKRDFIDPFSRGELPIRRRFVKALATDNKYLPADYIETLRSEKDLVRRQRLYLGDWDYDESKDSIISYDYMLDTFSNTIVKTPERYMVIDVARFGKDSTVFTFWHGLELVRIIKKQKQSIAETIREAKEYATKYTIPFSHIIIDEDGVGGGVVDGMLGVRGFVANSTALPTSNQIRMKMGQIESYLIPKTNYANLKSQCGYKLAELINEHKIAFSVPEFRDEIVADLSALLKVKEIDSDKKLQLRSKDDVKEEIGRSPDVGDPIIMRMWFELQKEAVIEDPNLEKQISLQRNIFNERGQMNKSTR